MASVILFGGFYSRIIFVDMTIPLQLLIVNSLVDLEVQRRQSFQSKLSVCVWRGGGGVSGCVLVFVHLLLH